MGKTVDIKGEKGNREKWRNNTCEHKDTDLTQKLIQVRKQQLHTEISTTVCLTMIWEVIAPPKSGGQNWNQLIIFYANGKLILRILLTALWRDIMLHRDPSSTTRIRLTWRIARKFVKVLFYLLSVTLSYDISHVWMVSSRIAPRKFRILHRLICNLEEFLTT